MTDFPVCELIIAVASSFPGGERFLFFVVFGMFCVANGASLSLAKNDCCHVIATHYKGALASFDIEHNVFKAGNSKNTSTDDVNDCSLPSQ